MSPRAKKLLLAAIIGAVSAAGFINPAIGPALDAILSVVVTSSQAAILCPYSLTSGMSVDGFPPSLSFFKESRASCTPVFMTGCKPCHLFDMNRCDRKVIA